MAHPASIVTVRPRRPAPVLVCKKCLKRAADGRAVRRALKTELKSRSAGQDVKSSRLVLTACFGICPKRAVVAASAATLARGEYLLLSDSDGVVAAVEMLTA